MLASTSGRGNNGYLLYYNKQLYYYENDDKIAQGQMADGAAIDDYLPGGKNSTSKSYSWVLVQ
jgi:hypothetical protein